MFLIFDTETTGLPLDWRAPLEKLDNWPRLVQIAWLLIDDREHQISHHSHIIIPHGFEIPPESSRVHRITTERARQEGDPLEQVLSDFAEALEEAGTLVAHNIRFDETIVAAEFLRKGIHHRLFDKKRICTMISSTEFCQIPGPYGFKWPTLAELHFRLFREEFEEAHDASDDVDACAKCFFELRDRGIV